MTAEPKNRLDMRDRLARITALRQASEIVGQDALADVLGVEPRSLRAKLSADRGISSGELALAAMAIDQHVARAQSIAVRLRELRSISELAA